MEVDFRRGRASALDPWLVIGCLAALAVYWLHGFNGQLGRDVAVYVYGGQQFAEGVAPYVAISNRAGPLAHAIPGLGVIVARGIGVDDLLGVRVWFMLISVACIGFAYLVARDLFRSRLAGVASAATLLSFHGFIEYATYGPREKTPMVLLALTVFLALIYQRWLTAGVLVALATLTWQPVFFGLFPAVVVAVLLGVPFGGRWRALLRFGVGGLIPTALIVGFYAVIGQLQVFLDSFMLINLRYTVQESPVSRLSHYGSSMREGYGVSLILIVIGIVSIVACAIVAARRPDRRAPPAAALIAVGVYTLGSLAWSMRAYDNWPDFFPMLPAASIGVGSALALVVRRIPRVALTVTASLATICIAIALVFSLDTNNNLPRQRADVRTVMKVLPEAEILSVESPEPLVLARKRNASRYQLFGNGMIDYVDATYPGGVAGFGRWVDEHGPSLIARGVGNPVEGWLAPTLDRSYQAVWRGPGWEWYARRDLGADKLEELQRALRQQSRRAQARRHS